MTAPPVPTPARVSPRVHIVPTARVGGNWQLAPALVLALVALMAAGLNPRAIPALFVAAVTAELCRSDLVHRRLPNRVVLPGIAVSVVSLAMTPSVVGILSGVGYFAFLLLLGLAGGMGMGDVKLGALLGVAAGLLGAPVAILSPVLAFTAGGLAGVVAVVQGKRSIPFGPFMLGGFWLAVALCAIGGVL